MGRRYYRERWPYGRALAGWAVFMAGALLTPIDAHWWLFIGLVIALYPDER